MEIIYPRNTRDDNSGAGSLGGGAGVVENQTINQTFQDFLTQYFSEDNSKSTIDTIVNNYGNMPDIGVFEMLFAYLQTIENELKKLRETNTVNTDRIIEKLMTLHAVVDLGEKTWNDFTEHIYMLTGGVPASVTINQYINNICSVIQIGSEFTSLDAATGLVPISLYDPEYVQQLIDSGGVIEIDGEKYVLLTACEIHINDDELGDQLGGDTQTEDDTSVVSADLPVGMLYNEYATKDARKISSSDDWRVPTLAEIKTGLTFGFQNRDDSYNYKEIDSLYWLTNDGVDLYGLGFRAGGYRDGNGVFQLKNTRFRLRLSDTDKTFYEFNDAGSCNFGFAGDYTWGVSVILCKDAVGVPDGEIIEYVGNDGRIYRAISKGGYYWTSALKETKFRTGDLIPIVVDSVAWGALGTAGCCVYDNEDSEVVTNGAVSGVDENGDLVVSTLTPAGELNEPKKISELSTRHLVPVFMRKIT